MPTSFAVVGAGRVGSALAKRWHEAGFRCLGFRSRTHENAARAVSFVGAGAPLSSDGALREATVVVLAVVDDALPAIAARLARSVAPRRCSLWLHTCGSGDLQLLTEFRRQGARIGSLHPLCPFPDAASGYRALAGAPAVIQGDRSSLRLLRVLAEKASMRPVACGPDTDRLLYHAACVLAANGLTVLFDLAATLLGRACRVDELAARELVCALMGAAVTACADRGARAALSGPVVRGDVGVVAAHLAALAAGEPAATRAVYRALTRHAVELAVARGALPAAAADGFRQLLDRHG